MFRLIFLVGCFFFIYLFIFFFERNDSGRKYEDNLLGRTYTDDFFTHFLLKIKKEKLSHSSNIRRTMPKNFGLERLFRENEKFFKAL